MTRCGAGAAPAGCYRPAALGTSRALARRQFMARYAHPRTPSTEQCQGRSREPEQSRYGVDTARPPPLAPGPAKPGRLLRGHRRSSAPGVPAQPRTAGSPGPWAPAGATRPIPLESRVGGIRSRRTAPRPEATGGPRPRGPIRLGLEANSRIRDLTTFSLRVFSAKQIHIPNNEPSLPSWRCLTSVTAFVG